MATWALAQSGVIKNVIVVADGDTAFIDAYLVDHTEYDRAVDISALDPQPAVGWVRRGAGYLPPITLVASKPQITGDGKDTTTVTYTDNRPNPSASVSGDVNGQPITVNLVAGVGSVDVTSVNSGDTVIVTLPGVALSIGVV